MRDACQGQGVAGGGGKKGRRGEALQFRSPCARQWWHEAHRGGEATKMEVWGSGGRAVLSTAAGKIVHLA